MCMFRSSLFFQKHKHGKELHYKGLPNEENYLEIFGLNSAIGCMAYRSGSIAPPCFEGVIIEEPTAPLYEDMSIGDQKEDMHVTPSLPATPADLPIN